MQLEHELAESGPAPASISQDALKQKISQFMQAGQVPCDGLANPKYLRIHALDLLDHWLETNDAWIGITNCQKVMKQSALKIGLERDAPYLVHAILAFSACHLNFLHPDDSKWAIASVLHYSEALNLYVRQLQDNDDRENSDQMIGCCTLLEMMAFWNLSKPASDWTEELDLTDNLAGDLADDLAALRTMRGSCFLRGTPGLYSDGPESIWRSVYNNDLCFHEAREDEIFEIDSRAVLPSGLNCATIESLESLCNVGGGTMSKNNIYHIPLQRLKRLMTLQLDRESIGWFMQWAGRLPMEFVQALESQDERSLLVLSFWAALFLQIDQWWIGQTAKSQCLRICEHLERQTIPDISALLEFPSQSCGARMNI